MSDTTGAFPPPPPPQGAPPPAYHQAAAPVADYTYQPPPVSQPPVGYPQQWQAQPWQQPQPPSIGMGMGAVGILSQFSGAALWGCIIGLATVVAPLFFGYVFFFLPIVGLLAGFRAIRAGKPIGGAVAIVLSAIGGLLTVADLVIR